MFSPQPSDFSLLSTGAVSFATSTTAPEGLSSCSVFEPPARVFFSDEGSEIGHLKILTPGFRDETLWFGSLSSALFDDLVEFPFTLSEMAGCDPNVLQKAEGGFDANLTLAIEALPFDKQREIRKFALDFNKRLRLDDGEQEGGSIVRRWTLQCRDGSVKPITAQSIEALSPVLKDALSSAIRDAHLSGETVHQFQMQ